MSNDITSVKGYNADLYAELESDYQVRTGKTSAELDKEIMALINEGKSFSDAIKSIRSNLPELTPPLQKFDPTTYMAGGLPSFGANYLAMITDLSAEQRRQNAEMRALQTEEMVAKIQEQAETIRKKAVTQLVTGIVSGTLSIAQGAASVGMTAMGLRSANEQATAAKTGVLNSGGTAQEAASAYTAAFQQANVSLGNKVMGFNTAAGGVTGIVNAAGQYVATIYDAEMKSLEGDVERIRAMQQMLESLDESLKALIQKSLSSQDAIQQNMNQTRTRILC